MFTFSTCRFGQISCSKINTLHNFQICLFSVHSPSVFECPPPLFERDDLVPAEVLHALVELLHRQHGERVVGDHRRLRRLGQRGVQLR